MFQKKVPAVKVHTLIVGSVESFIARRDRVNSRPPRESNLRDVVGARQTPTIRDTFCEEVVG
jgi:hypothetical protein